MLSHRLVVEGHVRVCVLNEALESLRLEFLKSVGRPPLRLFQFGKTSHRVGTTHCIKRGCQQVAGEMAIELQKHSFQSLERAFLVRDASSDVTTRCLPDG